MTKVTWNGENGGPDQIEQYGVIFPKGVAVDVPATHKYLEKFRGNRFFEVAEEAEPNDETGYEAVHKGRGVWAVRGPNGFMSPATFTKEEAIAFAVEKNGSVVEPEPDETTA